MIMFQANLSTRPTGGVNSKSTLWSLVVIPCPLTSRIFALGADGFDTVKFLDTMQDSPEDRGLLTWLTSTVSLTLYSTRIPLTSSSSRPSHPCSICSDTLPPHSYSTSSPALDHHSPPHCSRMRSPIKLRTVSGRVSVPWSC